MKHFILTLGIFLITACGATASPLPIENKRIYTPQDFGAVCDAEWGAKEASYDKPNRTLTITYTDGDRRIGTADDIGKVVGYGGSESIVESITPEGNLVTVDQLNVNNTLWYLGSLGLDGTDDTDNINAGIQHIVSDHRGGSIDFKNSTCLIKLSEADYNAGRTSAIVIDKPIGVPLTLTNSGGGQRGAGFVWRWGSDSWGDAIGNTHGTAIDFFTMENLFVQGVGFAMGSGEPKRRACFKIVNPHKNFYATDSHSRLNYNSFNNCRTNGVYYEGRGEFHMTHNNIGGIGEDGVVFEGTYDNKLMYNTIAATNHACLRINRSGSTIVDFQKHFYCGLRGGTDYKKSAGTVIHGKQWRNGHTYLTNINHQEIRGSCVVIEKAGALGFDQTITQGCGRQIGDQTQRPNKIADIHVIGYESYHIDFGDVFSTGFPLYGQQINNNDDPIRYHGWKNAFMIIDGDYKTGTDPDTGETRERGARDIKARFHFPEPHQHVRGDYKLEYGPTFENTASGTPVELCIGAGCTNGYNPKIFFNDVSLPQQ